MAKQDEISSTEKLLNLIRSKDNGQPAATGVAPVRPSRKPKRKLKVKRLAPGKNATLGVDFGRRSMRLAVIDQAADKRPVLVKQAMFEYDNDLTIHSHRFSSYLRPILDDFCRSHRKIKIWSTIPSTNVEIRYIQIPKVPRKQVASTVFWTFRKESKLDEKESIFDFEMLGDTVEGGRQKTNVLCYTAPKSEVENLERIFSKTGHGLTGVSIVPFALQNLFRSGWMETGGKSVCTLFIGSDWSRIAIFSDSNLILCRDIKAGLQSMIESIAEDMEETHPELGMSFDDGQELALAETSGAMSPFNDTAQKILEGFINGDIAVDDRDPQEDMNPSDVFQMIVPALSRIVGQVERTLDHYYLNYDRERVNKVYLSGPICSHKRLVAFISSELGLLADYIDPFFTELPGAVDVISPESSLERGQFVPAIGMALSTYADTPNFIYTYKDRQKSEKVLRLNQSIFGVSLLLMLMCIGYFAWQTSQLGEKEVHAMSLQQSLDSYVPRVDQNMILTLTADSFSERQSVDAFAERYRGMAVISEIIKITPENIRLAGMTIHLGGVEGAISDKIEKALLEDGTRTVLMDGIISGDRLSFESALAGYMVKLENSKMFGRPEIIDQSSEALGEEVVLRFTARVEII